MGRGILGDIKYNYVMRYLNGESPSKLGKEISPLSTNPSQSIFLGKNQYLKGGIVAFKPFARKREFIKRKKPIDWSKFSKEELIEILKIYDDLIKIKDKREAFQIIKNYRGILSIRKLCYLLGLNRSSFYGGLRHLSSDKYHQIWLDAIETLFFKYNGVFGVRRIRIYLKREFKLDLNHKTVYRYMFYLGLKSKIRVKNTKRYHQKTAKKGGKNLINQNFIASEYHQKIFTDVTFIPFKNRFVYLSIVIDCFNNEIIDFQLSKSNNGSLIKSNLEATFKIIKTCPILHSDHGIQYVSNAYRAMVKQGLFKPSMSRLGVSLDNRPAEYFFSILKEEALKDFDSESATLLDLKTKISNFMHYYNNERVQSSLENLTPIEYKSKYKDGRI